MKILFEIAHVKLYLTDNNLLELHIEDTEVFDTFDDILLEQFNIENYSTSSEIKNGITNYRLYFQKEIEKENLIKALNSITEREVIRIYKLNN